MSIYSCFLFFKEFDLLEIKLETLNHLVDYFIISESTFTHSGKPKELFYETNKGRFKKFHHKIIHQIITDTPSNYLDLKEDCSKGDLYNLVIQKVNSQKFRHKNLECYGRDCFEKESLIRALVSANNDDLILLSDLDEIVKPESLERVINSFDKEQTYYFYHNTYYYYLNLKSDEPSHGTIALTYEKFSGKSHSAMREDRHGIFIPDSGWHFTSIGDTNSVRTKLESFSHQEFNTDSIKNALESNIKNAVKIGKDLYGRQHTFCVEPIIYQTHPHYLVDNQERYKHLIL